MARPKTKVKCTVRGCKLPYRSQGLCRRHLNRKLTKDAPPALQCSVRGCKRYGIAKGWCQMHYSRVRAHGSPGGVTPLVSRGFRRMEGWYVTKNGYRKVRTDGGWVLEHRTVVERRLGRPLRPFENVHHKDGNKLNNADANLELWVRRQPSGQRVKDLLRFAKWVFETYGESTCAIS